MGHGQSSLDDAGCRPRCASGTGSRFACTTAPCGERCGGRDGSLTLLDNSLDDAYEPQLCGNDNSILSGMDRRNDPKMFISDTSQNPSLKPVAYVGIDHLEQFDIVDDKSDVPPASAVLPCEDPFHSGRSQADLEKLRGLLKEAYADETPSLNAEDPLAVEKPLFASLLDALTTSIKLVGCSKVDDMDYAGRTHVLSKELTHLRQRRKAAEELLDDLEAEVLHIDEAIKDKCLIRSELLGDAKRQRRNDSNATNCWRSGTVDEQELFNSSECDDAADMHFAELRSHLQARLAIADFMLAERDSDISKLRREVQELKSWTAEYKRLESEHARNQQHALAHQKQQLLLQRFAAEFDSRTDATVRIIFLSWQQHVHIVVRTQNEFKKKKEAMGRRYAAAFGKQASMLPMCFAAWWRAAQKRQIAPAVAAISSLKVEPGLEDAVLASASAAAAAQPSGSGAARCCTLM